MKLKLSSENFKEEVLNSEEPVLVDFYADWCGPCNAMSPVIEELAKELEGKAKVGKINVDENSDIAVEYNVMSIPTLIVFKNGKEEKRLVAEQLGVNKDDIKPESRFKEDLNADSLDLFELIMSLEEEYSTEIPTDELENLTTIQSVIDYLGAKGIA